MSESASLNERLFFEIFESLPRQGPGSRASAERALALCADLPMEPKVIDLGCGTGAQTFYLAELTQGSIVAVDSHSPNIERLQATIKDRGLTQRISALAADFADLDQPRESFDLVWSEGALYNLGLDEGLRVCRNLLRPEGYLVFTDAVWRADDPPAELRAAFESDYPTMGRVSDAIAAIDRGGFTLLDHFTLPDEAWWDDFYTPMLERLESLREKYATNDEALAALRQLAEEPAMHRRYGEYYAYEFFIAQRKD